MASKPHTVRSLSALVSVLAAIVIGMAPITVTLMVHAPVVEALS